MSLDAREFLVKLAIVSAGLGVLVTLALVNPELLGNLALGGAFLAIAVMGALFWQLARHVSFAPPTPKHYLPHSRRQRWDLPPSPSSPERPIPSPPEPAQKQAG